MDTEERAAFTAAAEHWIVRGGGLDIEVVPPCVSKVATRPRRTPAGV